MILLKDESVKIMNEFNRKNRSAVMNLLTHHYSIPEFDADDILQDAWVLLLEKLTVGEMHDVPEKLSAYLTKVCSYKAHEYLRKRQLEVRNISFDDAAFTPEELTTFEMEAQSWDDFLEECRRAEHRRLDMMEAELEKLTPKETALLMGYYTTDGSKTSMHELAQRMGYSTDRVAITLRSRIMKKLRTGIQQQERAFGDGLSPVAFYGTLLCGVSRQLIIDNGHLPTKNCLPKTARQYLRTEKLRRVFLERICQPENRSAGPRCPPLVSRCKGTHFLRHPRQIGAGGDKYGQDIQTHPPAPPFWRGGVTSHRGADPPQQTHPQPLPSGGEVSPRIEEASNSKRRNL